MEQRERRRTLGNLLPLHPPRHPHPHRRRIEPHHHRAQNAFNHRHHPPELLQQPLRRPHRLPLDAYLLQQAQRPRHRQRHPRRV